MIASRSALLVSALVVSPLLDAASLEASRAVETSHFEFGLASSDSDTDNSTSNGTLGVNAAATFPLGSYFGAAIGGSYSESSVRTRDVLADGGSSGGRPSCDFDSVGGNVSLFFRRPTFGKIAVSYGVGELSSDCGDDSLFLLSGDDTLSTDNYRIEAEYYLGDFTLGAARITTKLEDGPELESTTVTGSWYPHDSFRVSLSGSDLYEQDTYGLMLEHQPEMLGDVFGVRLGYSTTDDEPKTRTIQLGLTYYFGKEISLKARDRQYR